MKILVIGGAGYVGSHAVRHLVGAGHDVLVYDNFCYGHRGAVRGVPVVEGDILDQPLLEQTLREHGIEAVMHFAAFTYVGESVTDPAAYYRNNIVGTLSILDAMRAVGVDRIVFSSTCATYGEPGVVPITESEPQTPINPYGFTKLAIERALDDYAHAYGLRFAALRYFNASGAAAEGDIGEDHQPETHLIPIALQVALGQREHLSIFGTDYPTPDGTCIRDYIHVTDLAEAHLAALEKLADEPVLKLNLGTGVGVSVKGIIDACRQVTGHALPVIEVERREGDPPELVADPSTAESILGWRAKHLDIAETIASAWCWHRANPKGYGS
ncbi:UDP-glucose 4-epimerase GalE [Marinihelvus fidelis]|uniref:UDP-glucose 4-epimerase n=1 Tax=Marinihelvus fidelis TaxID=2613842 RepID=A0A5N0TCA8_9GAMM|nr:UDP-glucose 4-epimerase GalE [Marinihelvus fidelis]KAA9132655.1 UDP-glucose 4-epimerase GalE [Marinihelvus fidelis]